MFVQFGLGNAQAAEDVGDPVRAEDAVGGHARVLRFESDGQAHISDEDEARDVPSISIALAKKSEGQVLHSYIRLLNHYSFFIKNRFTHPPSILLEYVLEATTYPGRGDHSLGAGMSPPPSL